MSGHSRQLLLVAKLKAKGLHSSSKPNGDPVRAGAGPRELVDFASNVGRAVWLV
jgi:hypothetical protein